MHLTGGQFKGRKISTPTGYVCPVKPTLSKVRESVFNVLNSYFLQNGVSGDNVFSELSFLDMFAGSGIMALEAYSRGFGEVFAIEKQPSVFCAVKKMYKDFNADIRLLKGDSTKLISELSKDGKFDVIYIDPPWDFDYAPIIEIALEHLSSRGVIIAECNKKGANQSYQFLGTEILPFREKIYGRCKLDFIRLP